MLKLKFIVYVLRVAQLQEIIPLSVLSQHTVNHAVCDLAVSPESLVTKKSTT
jgi:hypothetical protein